jgi:hypothetical protein
MRTLTASFVLLATLSLSACSSPGSSMMDASMMDASPDVQPSGPPGFTARFNVTTASAPPAPFAVPFPSDLYLDADHHVVGGLDFTSARLGRANNYVDPALQSLDGFGLNTGAMFVLDGVAVPGGLPPDLDTSTLPSDPMQSLGATAAVFMLDLDPSVMSADARVPCVAGWQPAFHMITVQPEHVVLTPGHQYAVVLTTGVRATTAPMDLQAAPAFAAIRDNAPGARAGAAGTLYGGAVDAVVARMGTTFDRTTIAALAVFTTQTLSTQLPAARQALQTTPAPTLNTQAAMAAPFNIVRFGAHDHPGWTATLDAWLGTPLRNAGRDVPGFPSGDPMYHEGSVGLAHDAIGVVMTGTYLSPDYRSTMGGIAFGADGSPTVVDANQKIPLLLVLPNATSCPMPASGYPAVIYGHGLGGQRREALGVANEIARACIAVAAIDHVDFGLRAMPMDDTMSIEHGTYHGPDGLGDHASYDENAYFGNLTNLVAFRDNMRQDALDLVNLRRTLANPMLDLSLVSDEYAGAAPRIDATHIGYVGESLGGIIGTVFTGIDPDINPVVLDVPGGAFITRLAVNAPNQATLLDLAYRTIFASPSNAASDQWHPMSNLIQMVLDSADAAVFAGNLTHPASGRPRDVFVIEAIDDETVANPATELLTSLMGLPQVRPIIRTVPGLDAVDAPVMANLAMGATGGYFEEVPATHGDNLLRRIGTHRHRPPYPATMGTDRFPLLATPNDIRQSIVALQQNIAAFLSSGFAGHAQIAITGMEPLLDEDDDGWTNDEEITAMTDPYERTSHPMGTPPHARDVGFPDPRP